MLLKLPTKLKTSDAISTQQCKIIALMKMIVKTDIYECQPRIWSPKQKTALNTPGSIWIICKNNIQAKVFQLKPSLDRIANTSVQRWYCYANRNHAKRIIKAWEADSMVRICARANLTSILEHINVYEVLVLWLNNFLLSLADSFLFVLHLRLIQPCILNQDLVYRTLRG